LYTRIDYLGLFLDRVPGHDPQWMSLWDAVCPSSELIDMLLKGQTIITN